MPPTKKNLSSFTKKELINKITELNNLIDSSSSKVNDAEVKNDTVDTAFLSRLQKLEESVDEIKNDNKTLTSRVDQLEHDNSQLNDNLYYTQKELYSLQQYIRWSNVELCNIPDDIPQKDLEATVIQALNQMEIDVADSDIEACHRLFKHKNSKFPANVIIRFKNRKHAYETLKKKKKTNDLNNDIFGKNFKKNIFIKENLCPHYRKIFKFCCEQRDNGELYNCWTFKGTVNVLFTDSIDESPTQILHYDDLWDLFP